MSIERKRNVKHKRNVKASALSLRLTQANTKPLQSYLHSCHTVLTLVAIPLLLGDVILEVVESSTMNNDLSVERCNLSAWLQYPPEPRSFHSGQQSSHSDQRWLAQG